MIPANNAGENSMLNFDFRVVHTCVLRSSYFIPFFDLVAPAFTLQHLISLSYLVRARLGLSLNSFPNPHS